MSQNDDDRNNQETEVSKLSRPSSVNKFFDSIQINPKLFNFQAKIRPNPFDKNTKISFKTNHNQLFGNGWINNCKLKFDFKDEKTKLCLSMKPNGGKINSDKRYKEEEERHQNEDNHEGRKKKEEKQNVSGMDLNLSTSYDNLKIGFKAKQKGQVQFKINQSCYLIPDKLLVNYEHLWQYKKSAENNKTSLQFVFENQITRQTYQNEKADQKFRKNQTLLKCKIGNSIDPQFKFIVLNHFGRMGANRLKPYEEKQKDIQQKTDLKQIIEIKLFLQNKLWLSSKSQDIYNFKSSIQSQHVETKQTVKVQNHLTERGFQNFQLKYISKYFSKFIFGAAHSLHWNQNKKKWANKWQLYFQKEKIKNLGNISLSLNSKFGGVRLKRSKGDVKVEVAVSKKWGDWDQWPKIGLKINANL